MKIKKDEESENIFYAESSQKNKFYKVDLEKNTCTCMHFAMRLRSTGQDCKHLAEVKKKYAKKSAADNDKLIEFVKNNKKIETIELLKKFKEKDIDEAIRKGIIIEEKGFMWLLE